MKKVTWKVVLLLILAVIYQRYIQLVSPIVSNQLAVNQMGNSMDSSLWIQAYSISVNNFYLVFMLVALLLFHKEIIKLLKRAKEKINEED